jgi:hypothetical protein
VDPVDPDPDSDPDPQQSDYQVIQIMIDEWFPCVRRGGAPRCPTLGPTPRRHRNCIPLQYILPGIHPYTVVEFLNNLWGLGEPSRNRVVVPARQATQPGGIGSLGLILGLLKSLKIRGYVSCVCMTNG